MPMTKFDIARHMKGSSAEEIHDATLDFPLPENYLRDLVIAGFTDDEAAEILALCEGSEGIGEVQQVINDATLTETRTKEATKMRDASAFVQRDVTRTRKMRDASAFVQRDVEEEQEDIEAEVATFMISGSSYNGDYDDYDNDDSGPIRKSNCTII